MTANELLQRLSAMATSGASVDWRGLREEIHTVHEQATTERDRVLCLTMHKTLMDFVERAVVSPGDTEQFQKTRSQDYALLLVRECMVGRTDGNVDPAKMLSITTREVHDGRMSPDDELHTLALTGAKLLGPRPERVGIGAKLRSWFK